MIGAIEELTEAVKKLNKKIDNMPVQGQIGGQPQPAEGGKFKGKEGLSDKDLAEYLGVSKSTVRRYKDFIPHTYLGDRLIFPKTAVLEWLREKAKENQKEPNRMEVDGAIIRKLTS